MWLILQYFNSIDKLVFSLSHLWIDQGGARFLHLSTRSSSKPQMCIRVADVHAVLVNDVCTLVAVFVTRTAPSCLCASGDDLASAGAHAREAARAAGKGANAAAHNSFIDPVSRGRVSKGAQNQAGRMEQCWCWYMGSHKLLVLNTTECQRSLKRSLLSLKWLHWCSLSVHLR